jgi:hypothetical protein
MFPPSLPGPEAIVELPSSCPILVRSDDVVPIGPQTGQRKLWAIAQVYFTISLLIYEELAIFMGGRGIL